MTILDRPFNAVNPGGVIYWEKQPEQIASDLMDGVARMGGYRRASYEKAYLFAAQTLLAKGITDGSLDALGLPIFYLQRHAAELLIKAPLNLALEIQGYRRTTQYVEVPPFPTSKKQAERIETSHKLSSLLADLKSMAEIMAAGIPPACLEELVHIIESVETLGATWSRYATSRPAQGTPSDRPEPVEHLKDEIELPLRGIQNLLTQASAELADIWPSDGVMGALGLQWDTAARHAGVID